jgi:hypothetical protein
LPQDSSEVSVAVDVQHLSAVKLGEKIEAESANFNVSVNLEEKERKSGTVVVNFTLNISTKPSVVKFETGGTATISGKDAAIEQMLKVDPETKVPFVLHRVYQQVFKAIFLLAALINTPHPPPDLFFSTAKRESETTNQDKPSSP